MLSGCCSTTMRPQRECDFAGMLKHTTLCQCLQDRHVRNMSSIKPLLLITIKLYAMMRQNWRKLDVITWRWNNSLVLLDVFDVPWAPIKCQIHIIALHLLFILNEYWEKNAKNSYLEMSIPIICIGERPIIS